jgi:hypothetical protein
VSVDWTDREAQRQVDRVYTATIEGLEMEVVDRGSLQGVSWSVVGQLADFNLHAYGLLLKTVEEAQAAALAAARRLLELGARGRS